MNPGEHPVISSLRMQQSSPHQENSMFPHNQKFRDSSITVDIQKKYNWQNLSSTDAKFLCTKYRIK